MPDEPALRGLAREAIRTRNLPGFAASRRFITAGDGNICSVCGHTINADELQVQLSFDQKGVGEHYLHLPCWKAWNLERLEGET